ncbi:hypothetical protein CSW58_02665 [Caulobacter sp. B11]|nr:hypothetical protein CSW58_02665 [Caulobacter sp. B11]
MAYKSADEILKPDSRFDNLCVVEAEGVRFMTLADHHRMIGEVALSGSAPTEVRDAYDRARNAMLYAFFDYDLLVIGEVQAFGAFELALKHRLNGHGMEAKGTLRNLVDRARKAGIFPKLAPDVPIFADRVEAMIMLRNGLAHGNSQIHSPGMALQVLEICAWGIDTAFPSGAASESVTVLPKAP